MTQFLLCAFTPPKDEQGRATSTDIRRVVDAQVSKLGKLQDFPIDQNLAVFTSTNQLMALTDEIEKLDNNAYSLLTRAARMIGDLDRRVKQDNEKGWADLCPGKSFDPQQSPDLLVAVAAGEEEEMYPLDDYIRRWQWDEMMVASKSTNVIEMFKYFSQEITRQEEELRSASTAYTEAGNKIQALRRRGEGSLLVKNLDEIGSRMTLVTDLKSYRPTKATKNPIYVSTRNMKTVLVVMKKSMETDFVKNYMVESDFVVPGSVQALESDNEFACYAVTILGVHLDDYKARTREHGWHVREFTYNPNLREDLEKESEDTVQSYLTESGKFKTHLEATFSHVATVWIHLKALRVFIESVLLYGIGANYKAFLIEASTKNIGKIHKELEKKFKDAIQDDMSDDGDAGEENEYHPYVSFQLNLLNLLPVKSRK